MTVILKDICFDYADKPVLQNINLQLESGVPYCIMGASGSGKTTLLNIILGTIVAKCGEISFSHTPRFAPVFQENRLINEMSAYKNITICCQLSREQIYQKAKLIDISADLLAKPVSALSGGEKRRIAILRAILCKNNIVILDEPFTGLDEATKASTIDFVKNNLNNRLCIFASHNLTECYEMQANLIEI